MKTHFISEFSIQTDSESAECKIFYLEALDGVLQRFIRFLELLSLGTKLAQKTSGVAQNGDFVSLWWLSWFQNSTELIEPGKEDGTC